MVDEPLKQATSFVGTLAALQESEKVLASNRQAALEALDQVHRAREEAARVKAEADTLAEQARHNFDESARKAEEAHDYAAAIREQANRTHDAHVSGAVEEAKRRVAAVEADMEMLVAERDLEKAKLAELRIEMSKATKLFDDVKKNIDDLRARLTL